MCDRALAPQPCVMTSTTQLPPAHPHRSRGEVTLPYHRLARAAERYRWWKPLATGLLATLTYCVLLLLLLVAIAVVGLAVPAVSAASDRFFDDPVQDLGDPGTYAIGMIVVALMLPAVLMASRALGAPPAGLVSSVAGRIRWGWLARCLGIGVAVYGAAQLGLSTVAALQGEPLAPRLEGPRVLVLVPLALLLVPFQAAAEEYVFRGYLVQTLGAWFRHPVVAFALPVPLFVVAHGYEPAGMTDIAVFALVAGWLTLRTGGLEAAIALHVVNNVVVSTLGAFGLADMNATTVSVTDLIASLLVTVVFAVAVTKLADRMRIEQVR